MTTLTTQSGVALTPCAYGTMQWGGTADASAARAMFDACMGEGIAHFDTALVYSDGVSESILGDIVGNRGDVFVATKAAYAQANSAASIGASFDASRARLKRDCIDLYYLHHFDDRTPLEESFEALAALQSSGAIRYIGVSNFAAWQVMKAQAICAGLGTKIDVIQPMMNLVKRQVEVEILPMCRDQGIQVCAYSPLGGGLLTGKYAASPEGRLADSKMYASRYREAWMHDAAVGLSGIAADLGVPAATLAVAWMRHYASDVHPILSARSVAQLQPSLDGLTYDISADVLAQITALSPTPAPATDRLEDA